MQKIIHRAVNSGTNDLMDHSEQKLNLPIEDFAIKSNDVSTNLEEKIKTDIVKQEVQLDDKTLVNTQKVKVGDKRKNEKLKNSIDASVSKSMEDCKINYERNIENLNFVEKIEIDDNLKPLSSNESPMLLDNKEEIHQAVPVKQNEKSAKIENKSLSMEKEESHEPCATHNEDEVLSVKANTSVTEISSSDDDDFIEVPIEFQSTSQSSCATSNSESTSDVHQTENLSSTANTQATEIE